MWKKNRNEENKCGCGGKHGTQHKGQHERTNKHLKWYEEEN